MSHILIVDDHKNTHLTLGIILRSESHTVEVAESGNSALQKLACMKFDIVITDLRLGDMDGIEILAHIRKNSPSTDVVVITAFGSIPSAVKAIKLGAYDYITKPLKREKIISLVRSLDARRSKTHIAEEDKNASVIPPEIIGECTAMKGILTLAKNVARSDVPVLISGESGTGKELIARFIHSNSSRASKSFVAINCGALPESLQESELFGYMKGAFTGAASNKKGIFEEADGGTVLLDEIGEMSLSSQVKLLRILQDGEIRPVGSSRAHYIDIRILAASNQSLETLVKHNKFREDLLYRIAMVRVHLPPLRERVDDIPILIDFFINKYAHRFQKPVMTISKNALRILMEHPWRGNIRELENSIGRAVLLCKDKIIDTWDLEILFVMNEKRETTKPLIEQEKDLILDTLKRTNWNQKRTAAALGIGITTLWRKIKKYQLNINNQ